MAAKSGSVVKRIAAERIQILYGLAKKAYKADPKLSVRYARLIKQIGRHYKITLDKEIKRHICKKCGALLVPGSNLSIRLVSSKRYMAYKCQNCNSQTRIPY